MNTIICLQLTRTSSQRYTRAESWPHATKPKKEDMLQINDCSSGLVLFFPDTAVSSAAPHWLSELWHAMLVSVLTRRSALVLQSHTYCQHFTAILHQHCRKVHAKMHLPHRYRAGICPVTCECIRVLTSTSRLSSRIRFISAAGHQPVAASSPRWAIMAPVLDLFSLFSGQLRGYSEPNPVPHCSVLS